VRSTDLPALLEFLRGAEALKSTHRSAHTATGERESVAAHTWRLCLMAMLVAPAFPDVDLARLLRICVVHDLGEALRGDIPAPEQARRARDGVTKSGDERADLVQLVSPLPAGARAEILGLYDEYESATTAEAKLAKALDKLETILQHTQGKNPPDFDYRFNLGYARGATTGNPLIEELRALLDAETERRAREND
jgi:putative hydrolase of HD superfamily